MIDTNRLVKAARVWHDAGCSLVPAAADGTKRPHDAWKGYQQQRATWPVVEAWLRTGNYDGIGIVCGAVSGHLEMFETEGRAADLYDPLGVALIEHGYADLWQRLCAGYREKTPSGGCHWLYRIADGPARGNLKLARRPATAEELAINPDERVKVLIETRGEGGFTIVAPSGGRTHPDGTSWERIEGAPANIPVITTEERDALHAIASMFDQMPEMQHEQREARPRNPDDPLRPGDDYNLRATWEEILQPHGWTPTGNLGTARTWRRPGKNIGISATTGRNDGDNLYVFSTSTPFDTEKPYSKFAAYTLLEHHNDYTAAARELGRRGYGQQREPATAPPPSPVAPPVVTGLDEEAFWTCRPELEHLRLFARARRTSPWAVLGVTLARIVTATPPFVVLPALVGSHASLNLFIALVGPSGGGKGASESAAGDALDVGDIEIATVGSGEGIGHLYAHREKGQVIRDRDAVLFTVPEVDNLVALAGRQGATLLPQLRSAWSGEKLGFSYADKNKALPIDRHTYRMGLVLGVQPGRAAPLLDDADGGTPQRFLWMPTTDPDAPDEAPAAPEPYRWRLDGQWKGDPFDNDGRLELASMSIPDEIRMQVGIASLNRLRAQGDALDGHAMLARLKTAAALALLNGRKNVSLDDWQLSETIMAVSTATRDSVVAYLASKNRQANTARGEAEGARAVMIEERIAEAAAKRVARKIVSRLRAADAAAGMGRSELRRFFTSKDRQVFDDALERAVEAGQVVVDKCDRGEKIKLIEKGR